MSIITGLQITQIYVHILTGMIQNHIEKTPIKRNGLATRPTDTFVRDNRHAFKSPPRFMRC